MSERTLRIFISSPSDVAEERVIAQRVVERLQREYAGLLILSPVVWEHEPLLASMSWQPQIPRPSECDIVLCILWSRLGTRFIDNATREDGTAYESGTAFEFEDALEGFKRRGAPDLLVYRKTTPPMLSLEQVDEVMERLAQKQALDAFIARWFFDPATGISRTPFHPFANSAQFEELTLRHLRKLCDRYASTADGAEAALAAPSARHVWIDGSPFRGLDVFEPEHASIFCGRTRAVGEVLQALRKQTARGKSFVLLIGASGSGKSSLIRAGVLPLLMQPGVMEGIGVWRFCILRPNDTGGDLADGLATALLRPEALPELAADGTDAASLAAMLRETPRAAAALVKGALSQAAAARQRADSLDEQPEARLALVIDQMEEIFTRERTTPEQRTRFIEALDSLASGGRTCVLATLRSDLYHRTQELPLLLELKAGEGLVDLVPPSAAEIAQMIQEPAQAAGLTFETHPETGIALDDQLLNAAVAHPSALPLLEFTLAALYDQRSPRGMLLQSAYNELGGLEGAIAHRAEQTFRDLPQETQAAFARIFRALVSLGSGEDEAVTRQPAALAELHGAPHGREFLEHFIAARLFTSGRDDRGEPIVTIAHEALLRNWPRLQAWLAEDREILRIRSRVQAAAGRWDAEGRPVDLLMPSGKLLEEARLLRHAEGSLGPLENDFLTASNARAERQLRLKQAGVALLAIFSLVAALSAALALQANKETHQALDMVRTERQQTERERLLGLAREGILYADKGRVRTAQARLLEATAGLGQSEPIPAWLELAYWDLYRRQPMPLAGQSVGSSARYIGFGPDGRQALVLDAERQHARLIDPLTGHEFHRFAGAGELELTSIAPDGRSAVATAIDSTIQVWDTTTGALRWQATPGTGSLIGLGFSDDSRYLIVGGFDADAWLFDLSTGDLLQTYRGHESEIYAVAISPDNRYVFASTNQASNHPLRVWDRATGVWIAHLDGHHAGVFALDCTPDGTRLVSGSYDKTLRVWQLPAGPEIQRIEAHTHAIDGLVCLPDNRDALTQSRDGSIKRWTLATGALQRTWKGDPSPFTGLAIDRAGAHLLTMAQGGRLELWSLAEEPITRLFMKAGEAPEFLFPDGAGNWAVAVGKSGATTLWDLATGRRLRDYPAFPEQPHNGALELSGQRLALAGSSSDVAVLDLDTGAWSTLLDVGMGDVGQRYPQDLTFTPDGATLLSLSGGRAHTHPENGSGGLSAIDPATLTVRWSLDTPFTGQVPRIVHLDPTEQEWVIGTNSGELVRGEIATGAVTATLPANCGIVGSIDWPTADRLIVGGSNRTISVFDLTNPDTAPRILQGHQGHVHSLEELDGGLTLVSAGDREETIRVWDVPTGQDLVQLPLRSPELPRLKLNAAENVWAVSPEVWRVGLAPDYLHLSAKLPEAMAVLAKSPADPAALTTLGKWCHLRGDWAWAATALEAAAAEGAEVPPLMFGQCYWQLDRISDAVIAYEFALASATSPAERWYLEQCLAALRRESSERRHDAQ